MTESIRIIDPNIKANTKSAKFFRFAKVLAVILAIMIAISTIKTFAAPDENASNNEETTADEESTTSSEWFSDQLKEYSAKIQTSDVSAGQSLLYTMVFPMLNEIIDPFKGEGYDALFNAEEGEGRSWEENLLSIDIEIVGTTFKVNRLSTFTFENNTNVSNILNFIFEIARNVAFILLIAMFCIGFMQSFLEGGQYEEITIKKLTMLGISIACVFLVGVISCYIMNLGTSILHAVFKESSTELDYSAATSLMEKWWTEYAYPEGANFIEKFGKDVSSLIGALGAAAALLLPWLASIVSGIIIFVVCVERALEGAIIVAASPFAVIDITGHDATGKLIRFFKSVMAIAIQGVIIAAILYISNLITSDIVIDALLTGSMTFSSFAGVVVLAIVKMSMCSKSREISRSIIG